MRLLRIIKQTDGETAPEAPMEPDAFWLSECLFQEQERLQSAL